MATRNNFRSENVGYDGFINIRITDKNGGVHSFKAGVALHEDRKLDAAILKDPEILQRAMAEGRLSMSVWIPEKESGKSLDL